MNLGKIIELLETVPREKNVRFGFHQPHSYRGDYSQLAVEPAEDVTIGEMLDCLKSAIGKSFSGYKGGEYTMESYVDVYISNYGEGGGDRIGATLINYFLWSNTEHAQSDES